MTKMSFKRNSGGRSVSKIMSVFLAVILLTGMIPGMAFADDDSSPIAEIEVENLTFAEGQGTMWHQSVEWPIPSFPITTPFYRGFGKTVAVGNPWIYYTDWPSKVKVTTKSGNTYEGFPYDVACEIAEKENIDLVASGYGYCGFTWESDQSYENQWGVGVHTAKIDFMGYETEFEIEITENPITSLEVEDKVVFQGSGDTFGLDPGDEDYVEAYNHNPSAVKITAGGKTYQWCDDCDDSLYDFNESMGDIFGESFGYTTSFDIGPEYIVEGPGEYEGVFYFGAMKAPYKLIVMDDTGSPEIPNVCPELCDVWRRLSGDNRYETMYTIIEHGWTEPESNTVIVATGEGFKDALSAAGLAGTSGAPIVLTDGKNLSDEAGDILYLLKPDNVLVAGGEMAVSDYVLAQIESITGVVPQRIAGASSSATSAELALAGSGNWNDGIAIIATNKDFKDALSAAPVAYSKGYPILLSDNGKSLSKEVLDALGKLGIKEVIIVGGTGAVSENVEKQLADAGIGVLERLAGRNGIETSAAIARWGIESAGLDANNIGIATSKNFPDALAGAAFCGYNNSVLILADDAAIDNAAFVGTYKDTIEKGYIFGGEWAVGYTTLQALINSLK